MGERVALIGAIFKVQLYRKNRHSLTRMPAQGTGPIYVSLLRKGRGGLAASRGAAYGPPVMSWQDPGAL